MLGTSFDAWHIGLGKIVGQHSFESLANGGAKGDVRTLIAGGIPRFAGIEVILSRFSLENFAGPRDANTLHQCFVRFHGHTIV